ncbi:unnamed protein product, partial [Choristocarpus tenellus]
KSDSALLRHELAYVLGQMQDASACETLENVLGDTSDDCMVRHEAAEALGAIGDDRSVQTLERFISDPAPEVSQTCELSLNLMAWRKRQADEGFEDDGLDSSNPYLSVDPAPSCSKSTVVVGVGDLEQQLRDASAPLFARYRAMFSLRNRGGEEAALALTAAFQDEDNALFKHEVGLL